MKPLTTLWTVPAEPVTEYIIPRVTTGCRLGQGVLFADAWRAVLVSPDGAVLWRTELPDGIFGAPVSLTPELAAYAGADNSLHLLDPSGRIVRTTRLDAGINTPILVRPDGSMSFGVGSAVCDVVLLGPDGALRWRRTVTRDDGMEHGLCEDANQRIWVSTREGLRLLSAQDGALLSFPGEFERCLSSPVRALNGIVAVLRSDAVTRLIVASVSGPKTLVELPPLTRARLKSSADGETLWWVGTETGNGETTHPKTWVGYFSGERRWASQLPGHVAVDSELDLTGHLWVGTATIDEGGERGELRVFSPSSRLLAKHTFDAGVGAPVLLGGGLAMVPTSMGIVGLSMT